MKKKKTKKLKIAVLGAAGLVGQNLIIQLRENGYDQITAVDKSKENLAILKKFNPNILTICADLADKDPLWMSPLVGIDIVIMLQAQISGLSATYFTKNTVLSTRNVLDVINQCHPPYLVHISSSVVNSKAGDFYSDSKRQQEQLILQSQLPFCILRPTLMFGWFDRKHLGWLSDFMAKMPFFPIPGHGRYSRQPLYEVDFCKVIINVLETRPHNKVFNISGKEKVDYIDIVKTLKRVNNFKTPIVKIPYRLFYFLIWVYSKFSKSPPFTTQQLEALVIDEDFEIIPWWRLFKVEVTPFEKAMFETFNHPIYAKKGRHFGKEKK